MFDWREYFRLSNVMISTDIAWGGGITREAVCRCAVSRAYYAAFCLARNYARDRKGFTPQANPDDHRNLRDYFRDEICLPKVARSLDKLRQWRNNCDYDDEITNMEDLLKFSLNEANKLITSLAPLT